MDPATQLLREQREAECPVLSTATLICTGTGEGQRRCCLTTALRSAVSARARLGLVAREQVDMREQVIVDRPQVKG